MSKDKKEPVLPNQIRARTNKQGVTNYYLVLKDNNNKLYSAWFRSDASGPLHISSDFIMKDTDLVIMNNINNFKPTLDKLHKEATK